MRTPSPDIASPYPEFDTFKPVRATTPLIGDGSGIVDAIVRAPSNHAPTSGEFNVLEQYEEMATSIMRDDWTALSPLVARLSHPIDALRATSGPCGFSLFDVMVLFNAEQCRRGVALLLAEPFEAIPSTIAMSMQQTRDTLKCVICQELLHNPVVSWCRHALCRVCAFQFMTRSDSTARCPTCQQHVVLRCGYELNPIVQRAVERLLADALPSPRQPLPQYLAELDSVLGFVDTITRNCVPRPVFASKNQRVLLGFEGNELLSLEVRLGKVRETHAITFEPLASRVLVKLAAYIALPIDVSEAVVAHLADWLVWRSVRHGGAASIHNRRNIILHYTFPLFMCTGDVATMSVAIQAILHDVGAIRGVVYSLISAAATTDNAIDMLQFQCARPWFDLVTRPDPSMPTQPLSTDELDLMISRVRAAFQIPAQCSTFSQIAPATWLGTELSATLPHLGRSLTVFVDAESRRVISVHTLSDLLLSDEQKALVFANNGDIEVPRTHNLFCGRWLTTNGQLQLAIGIAFDVFTTARWSDSSYVQLLQAELRWLLAHATVVRTQ